MADNTNPASSNTSITPSYTTDAGAVQDRINALSAEVTKGYKDLPSYQDQLAKRVTEEEGFMKPTAEARGAMINELFAHDQNYSKNFAAPTATNYIENPMARSAGQNAEAAPLWGSLSALGADLASRRTLLGDAITRAAQARRDELAGKDSEMTNLWKTLNMYQTQAKEATDKEELKKKVSTWQDVGNKKIGYNVYGEAIVSVDKSSIDDILNDNSDITGNAGTAAGGAEVDVSPEEAAAQIASVMQSQSDTQLRIKAENLNAKIKSGQFTPSDIDELNKIDAELKRRQNSIGPSGPNLSGALNNLDPNAGKLIGPTLPTGNLGLGGANTNSNFGGITGLSIDPNTGRLK